MNTNQKVISLRDEHPLKVYSPIKSTEEGIIISLSEEQS